MANRGCVDITEADEKFINWASPKEIQEAYGYGLLYNLSSEFIYFKKCNEIEQFFWAAQDSFDTLKVHHMLFGNGVPDELPFIVAMLLMGVYPHTAPFLPSYWELFFNKNMQAAQMYNKYYAYSLGGAVQNNNEYA